MDEYDIAIKGLETIKERFAQVYACLIVSSIIHFVGLGILFYHIATH